MNASINVTVGAMNIVNFSYPLTGSLRNITRSDLTPFRPLGEINNTESPPMAPFWNTSNVSSSQFSDGRSQTPRMRCLMTGYGYMPDTMKYTHDIFKIYLCGLTIFIGLVGNTMTLCTIPKLRRSTTNVLLMALAIVDNTVLLSYAYHLFYNGIYQKFDLITKEGGFFYLASPYMGIVRRTSETASL